MFRILSHGMGLDHDARILAAWLDAAYLTKFFYDAGEHKRNCAIVRLRNCAIFLPQVEVRNEAHLLMKQPEHQQEQ